MADWNTDISKAPRGAYQVKNRKFGSTHADSKVFRADKVILATKCGQVTMSRYLPEAKRFEGLATGEQPVAWMPWAPGELPTHPTASREAAQ
jgi:hypothetical protein